MYFVYIELRTTVGQLVVERGDLILFEWFSIFSYFIDCDSADHI